MVSSKFHFQEIDWVIYFPRVGNEGRDYPKYGVAYRDRKIGLTQPGIRINLEEVVKKPEIQENFPHTVGYFLHSSGKGKNWLPNYLEVRKIANLNEFYKFLKDLHI
ncbi:MAG: hypothetical protein QXR63_04115 [Candidatus Bathyarchaeia archaeon]